VFKKVRNKIAVDPNFTFSRAVKFRWYRKNFYNFFAKYHESTSDNYFPRIDSTDNFDVVFIDGFHTYEQSLRDVINSLGKLNENGVIVMHDCNPLHYAAAYPAKSFEHAMQLNLPGWNGAWQGDVWKTICFLRSIRNDLRIFVLDCDCGLGIITRGEPKNCLNLSKDDLFRMTYDDLKNDREKLLNLKDESYLSAFLESVR